MGPHVMCGGWLALLDRSTMWRVHVLRRGGILMCGCQVAERVCCVWMGGVDMVPWGHVSCRFKV